VFFFLTQFLQDVLGYSPFLTGLAFLPLTVVLFLSSQLCAQFGIERFGGKTMMVVGLACSSAGLLWLTGLHAGSNYLALLGPLALFGIGNGLAFVPLTAVSLAGVRGQDAGAASGLVNVMQQVGGAVGLAVLVTIFGTASRHDLAHPPAGLDAAAAHLHAFIAGADRAFLAAALFLVAALLLTIAVIRGGNAGIERHPAELEQEAAPVS
ncbi:MAG TPA: MFS transporter, partial [Mycobacteriales bacterium]|nr:MFS transporter [Mycobacteriales bacterium]